jgi:hypothetical protein
MRTFGLLVVAAGLALPCVSVSARADDPFAWTGSYEGFVTCDDATDGVFATFARPVTARIVQTGDTIVLDLSAVVEASAGVTSTTFRGEVMTDPSGTVSSGYVESCRGSFPHTELARFFPATARTEGFAFSADTIFVSRNVPGEAGRLVVESCRWSLTRISTETPEVGSC